MGLCHKEVRGHVDYTNHFPSFCRFDGVRGPFWAKKGCFGGQNAQFCKGTSRLGAPASVHHRYGFGSKFGFGEGTT